MESIIGKHITLKQSLFNLWFHFELKQSLKIVDWYLSIDLFTKLLFDNSVECENKTEQSLNFTSSSRPLTNNFLFELSTNNETESTNNDNKIINLKHYNTDDSNNEKIVTSVSKRKLNIQNPPNSNGNYKVTNNT